MQKLRRRSTATNEWIHVTPSRRLMRMTSAQRSAVSSALLMRTQAQYVRSTR